MRKVVSSLAAEALVLMAVMVTCVYFKGLLKDIFGEKMATMPIVLYTVGLKESVQGGA